MIDHVTLRVADFDASLAFYSTVLAPLGHGDPYVNADRTFAEWGDFSVMVETDQTPRATHVHIAFEAQSTNAVDAFWKAGTDEGYASLGDPGERPQYHKGYYGAYVRDPDGHNVEAVYHHR